MVALALVMCACGKSGKGKDSDKVTESAKPTSDAARPTTKVVKPTAEATATPTPTEPVKISLAFWCDVTENDVRRHAFEMAASEMVKRHPEIDFSWESYDSDTYWAKLENAKKTGDLPDIFLDRIGEDFADSAESGRLYCLDEVYGDYSDSLPRKACDDATVDGRLYGIPYTEELFCMYVNTNLLGVAGFDKVPSTYRNLIDCCEALAEKGITPFAFCGADAEYVSQFLESVMEKTCGGRTLKMICSGTSGWDNGEVAGAVNAFRYMADNGYFGEDYLTASYIAAKDQFAQGKAAFFLDTSRNAGEYAAAVNAKVTEFPVLNSKRSGQGQLIGETKNILAVSSGSANPETAAKFAYEFASLVSKDEYLSRQCIPVWKVDYADPDIDLMTRSVVSLANSAKITVPYMAEAMGSAEAERFRRECEKLLSEKDFDGMAFVRDMSNKEIPEGTLTVYDPLEVTGGAVYDPSRDLNDMEIVIGDWWSGDEDIPPYTEEEIIRAQYLEEMMERHHFSIKRRTVCEWNEQTDSYILSILANEPLADVMAVDYRFIGGFLYDTENQLIADVSQISEFDFSDSKWNQQIRQSMTVGTAVYGFTTGKEPSIGVFWNKKLVEQILGKGEVNRIYDLQASGLWTWDAFRDFVLACTRDTDANGTIDIYGLSVYQANFFEAAVLSNGHQFVSKGTDGKYINNVTSAEIVADCNWAYSFYEDGLIRRPLSDENWDYYWSDFYNQKAVMVVCEEYYANMLLDIGADGTTQPVFDYGFACFPKGPNAADLVSVSKDYVYVIPGCPVTQERIHDIAFAYNLFTDDPPELQGDSETWKTPYKAAMLEDRAIDETIDRMLNSGIGVSHLSMLIPGLWDNNVGAIQMNLLYTLDGADAKPEARLKAANAQIQSCVDAFNDMYLK